MSAVYTNLRTLTPFEAEVVARLQSPATGDAGLGLGQSVGLRFVPEAIQVLED